MSRLQTWMKLVFPVAGLLLLAVTVAWPDAAASPARNPELTPTPTREPELTPRAYLPLVVNCHPFSPDICCEPDDQPSQACHIPPGVYQAHISSPYDQDWYTFILDGESQVTIRLRVPGGDNYDLYLYGDPPGEPIAHSATAGNAEETIAVTLSAGSYYVLVFPAAQESELPYELTLEVTAAQVVSIGE